MSKNSSSEGSLAVNSHDSSENEGAEIRASTQKKVNEQIKSFFAPLTRQLEDLTRLIQGITTGWHPNYHPRADTNVSYSAPGYQPDNYLMYNLED